MADTFMLVRNKSMSFIYSAVCNFILMAFIYSAVCNFIHMADTFMLVRIDVSCTKINTKITNALNHFKIYYFLEIVKQNPWKSINNILYFFIVFGLFSNGQLETTN